jgi:hypothetical protein
VKLAEYRSKSSACIEPTTMFTTIRGEVCDLAGVAKIAMAAMSVEMYSVICFIVLLN